MQKRIQITRFLLLIVFHILSSTVFATSYSWNGLTSNWGLLTNWTPNGVPGVGDDVTIVTKAAQPQLDMARSVANFTITSGTLNLNTFTLGVTGNGTFTAGIINNGALNLTGAIATFTATTFGASITAVCADIYLNGGTYNGAVSFTKTGSTQDNGAGGNTFNNTTTLSCTGSGIFLLGFPSGVDVFNGDLTLNNTGTSAIYLAYNTSGHFFNGNITINQTTGTGIYFCAGTGTATLATGKTISVGGSGFSSGILSLRKFTQTGATAQALNLTGTSSLIIGSSSSFGGDFTSTSGSLFLNGCTFSRTTNITKTGSADDISTGGNTFTGVSTITNSGSGYLQLANVSPDIFSTDLMVNSSGTSYIHLASSSAGNQFNGNTSLSTTGSGITNYVLVAENAGSTAVFAGTVTANNFGTGINALIRFNLYGSCTFNGNIILNSTGGSNNAFGILFSWPGYTGTATLADTKTITVGASGFSKGYLYFGGFTQIGTTAQFLTLTGTAILEFANSTFNGNITTISPSLLLDGSTFQGTATFTKNGSSVDTTNTGGNTFNGTTSITNSGSGYMILANVNRDIYQNVTINNTGTSYIYVAGRSSGNQFNGTTTLNNIGNGTTSYILVCELSSASSATFNGVVTVNNGGTATVNSFVRFHLLGTCTFNNNIIVNNNAIASTFNGVYFSTAGATGRGTLATTKTLTIGGTGFGIGNFYISNFTQLGSTSQALTLSGTGLLTIGSASIFNGNVNFVSPGLELNGGTYGGTTTLEKTGASDNISIGNNTFNGTTSFTHSGSGYERLGNSGPDIFNAATTFINSGSNYTAIGYNSAGNQFNGDVTFTNSGTGAANFFYASATLSVSSVAFNGNVIVNNTNTNAIAGVYLGGNGAVTMASGKTISIGSSGFTGGVLRLQQFIQNGTAAETITLTGTAKMQIGPSSVFNGPVNFIAPQFELRTTTFNNTASIEKNGATDNLLYGGNVFNSSATIKCSGPNYLLMAFNAVDDFNDNATFQQTGVGILYATYNGNNTFAKNISTTGTSTAIIFGFGGGRVTMDGTTAQAFNGAAAQTPILGKLTMATTNADLTLNVPINITVDLTLTTGKINTTSTNILSLTDETTTTTIGNANSYINGPMNYTMSLSGSATLNFPIGKSTDWRPAVLTPTHNAATAYTYTAELMNTSAQALGYTIPASITWVSKVHYWQIDRSASSTNLTSSIIKLYYDVNDVVNDYTNLTIVKNTAAALTTWTDIGGTATANTTGNILSGSFPSFSKFTIANKTGGTNPLPVELLSFDAQPFQGPAGGNEVDINWTTASESNSDYFIIQRSKDGSLFEDLEKVEAVGNSTTLKNYSDSDNEPYNGISYYRLKQVDNDEQYKFSKMVAVNMNPDGQMMSVYPNPTNGLFNISIQANAGDEILIVVRDLFGREFYSKIIILQNEREVIAVDPSGKISPGVYIITATSNNTIYEKKMVIK